MELGGGIVSSPAAPQPWAVSQLFARCHFGGQGKAGRGGAEPSPALGGGHCGACWAMLGALGLLGSGQK